MATRTSSRIPKDGKSTVEKAQIRKMTLNLEIPVPKKATQGIKNSFAVLDDAVLMQNASKAGISLGSCHENATANINVIRNVELDRLANFHEENPDMFLPSDINITAKDVSEFAGPSRVSPASSPESHSSDDQDTSAPWIEVSSKRKSSKRKLKFNHGSRFHLE